MSCSPQTTCPATSPPPSPPVSAPPWWRLRWTWWKRATWTRCRASTAAPWTAPWRCCLKRVPPPSTRGTAPVPLNTCSAESPELNLTRFCFSLGRFVPSFLRLGSWNIVMFVSYEQIQRAVVRFLRWPETAWMRNFITCWWARRLPEWLPQVQICLPSVGKQLRICREGRYQSVGGDDSKLPLPLLPDKSSGGNNKSLLPHVCHPIFAPHSLSVLRQDKTDFIYATLGKITLQVE